MLQIVQYGVSWALALEETPTSPNLKPSYSFSLEYAENDVHECSGMVVN